jgi:hypothetical protein
MQNSGPTGSSARASTHGRTLDPVWSVRRYRSVVWRLIVFVVALGAVGMVTVDPASATLVDANVSVQGAGQVLSNGFPSQVCNRDGNVDDHITVSCGRTLVADPDDGTDPPVTLALTAVPRSGAGAHSFVRWEGCDSAANSNPCVITAAPGNNRTVVPKAVFDDSRPPTVTLGAPRYSDTSEGTVSFPALGADEDPATIECSIDNGAFSACAPTTAFTLAEGSHEVRARARDASGNVSASGPVNVRILDTQLLAAPPDFAASASATFTFATRTGLAFDCSFDAVALADCGSKGGDNTLTRTFDNLTEGEHTFRVRARDGADFDRVPAVRTWTVDTVPPDTELDPNVGPDDGDVTTLLTAAFAISANEQATVQCRLAPDDFAACASQVSFADLPFGQNRFEARAVDRAGNVDATPATRTWTVAAVDSDGDGVDQRGDCNENDPSISPGRPEVRGNRVDENCDGVALPFPRLRVAVSYNFRASARATTLTKLQIKDVPRGARMRATCAFKRKKCPGKARKPFSVRRAAGTVSLNGRYRGVSLKVGTTITVTVTQSEAIGSVKLLKIRRSKAPTIADRCLPPGTRRPQPCGRGVVGG